MATMLVDSLRRLYKCGKLSEEQIKERVQKGSITPDDYETITGNPYHE